MDLRRTVQRLLGLGGTPGPAGHASRPGGTPAVPSVPKVAPAAWRNAEPIRRASGPPPLVAQRRPLEPGLEGIHDTALALEPLGHDVGIGAPPGLITVAHADLDGRDVAHATVAIPATVRPVQRRRHESRASSGLTTPDDTPSTGDGVRVSDPGPDAPEAGASPPVVPVVARMAERVDRTAAPVPAPPGRIGRPVVASSPMETGTRPPSAGTAAFAGEPTPAQPPVVARRVDAGPSRISGMADPGSGTGAPGPAGRPRRIRLGPAIASEVMRSAASRTTSEPDTTPGSGPRTAAAPRPSLPPPARPAGAGSGRSADSDSTPTDSSHDLAALGGHAVGGPGPSDAELGHAAEPPVVARLIDGPSPANVPLVGALRPLLDPGGTAVAVGRPAAAEADEASSADRTIGGPAAALAALARVDPFGAPSAGRGSGAAPTRTLLQRHAADAGHGPPPTPAAAGLAGSAPHTGAGPVWRSTATAAPGDTVARTPDPRFADRTALAPAPVQRSGSGSLAPSLDRPESSRPRSLRLGAALPAPRAARPGPRSADDGGEAGTEGLVVSRAAEAGIAGQPAATALPWAARDDRPAGGGGSGRWADAPTVQRQAGGASTGGPGAGSGPGPAGGSAAGAATAIGPEPTERDLDVLAGRLYERIGQRIRRELLVDRERAGVLIDLGH